MGTPGIDAGDTFIQLLGAGTGDILFPGKLWHFKAIFYGDKLRHFSSFDFEENENSQKSLSEGEGKEITNNLFLQMKKMISHEKYFLEQSPRLSGSFSTKKVQKILTISGSVNAKNSMFFLTNFDDFLNWRVCTYLKLPNYLNFWGTFLIQNDPLCKRMLYVVEWNIYQDKDFDTSLFLFYKTRRTICDMSQFSQKNNYYLDKLRTFVCVSSSSFIFPAFKFSNF